MRQWIREIWFPTAVFLGAWVGFSLLFGGGPRACSGHLAASLLSIPPIWWWLVSRRGTPRPGRGAAAGALGAILSWELRWIAMAIWWQATRDPKIPRDAFGEGMGSLMLFYLGLAGLAVAGPVGGALGALCAYFQGRWMKSGVPGGPEEIAAVPAHPVIAWDGPDIVALGRPGAAPA